MSKRSLSTLWFKIFLPQFSTEFLDARGDNETAAMLAVKFAVSLAIRTDSPPEPQTQYVYESTYSRVQKEKRWTWQSLWLLDHFHGIDSVPLFEVSNLLCQYSNVKVRHAYITCMKLLGIWTFATMNKTRTLLCRWNSVRRCSLDIFRSFETLGGIYWLRKLDPSINRIETYKNADCWYSNFHWT